MGCWWLCLLWVNAGCLCENLKVAVLVSGHFRMSCQARLPFLSFLFLPYFVWVNKGVCALSRSLNDFLL